MKKMADFGALGFGPGARYVLKGTFPIQSHCSAAGSQANIGNCMKPARYKLRVKAACSFIIWPTLQFILVLA